MEDHGRPAPARAGAAGQLSHAQVLYICNYDECLRKHESHAASGRRRSRSPTSREGTPTSHRTIDMPATPTVELLPQAPRSEAGNDNVAGTKFALPHEINLKDDPDFVAQVSKRLRKSSRQRLQAELEQAAQLRANLPAVVDEPNVCLCKWIELIDRHMVASVETQQLKPMLAQELARGRIPRGARMQLLVDILYMIHMPLIQLYIMVMLFNYQVFTEIDWESGETLCRSVDSTVTGVLDTTYDVTLFYVGVRELHSLLTKWYVAGFIASLKCSPLANSLLLVCAILAQVTASLYIANLYVLLMHTPDYLDCLLNCLALTFVMELDTMVMKLSPRLQHAASQTLGEMIEAADFNDFVLFVAAPRAHWAPWGLHHIGLHATSMWKRRAATLVRNTLLLVSAILPFFHKYVIPFVFVFLFCGCTTVAKDISVEYNPWHLMASFTVGNSTQTGAIATLHRSWVSYTTQILGFPTASPMIVAGPIHDVYPPAPPVPALDPNSYDSYDPMDGNWSYELGSGVIGSYDSYDLGSGVHTD